MITRDWKIGRLLEEYPQTLDVLLAASPHFAKLKNKFLRRALAPRVTVEQAASIGGVDVDDLLKNLNAAVGETYTRQPSKKEREERELARETNRINEVILESLPAQKEVLLDVRPTIEAGSDPLRDILKVVKGLKGDEVLHLVNSFEPIPLYAVLEGKGFDHFTKLLNGVWNVYFYRKQSAAGSTQKEERKEPGDSAVVAISNRQPAVEKVIELDVRGLPPPEPMMKILEMLSQVDDQTVLLVHHHREPLLLYEKLEQRGYTAVTAKLDPDNFKIVVRKKGT